MREEWVDASAIEKQLRALLPQFVYFADTGEPRAIADPATGRLQRGPSGTMGPYPNGRIFRMGEHGLESSDVPRLPARTVSAVRASVADADRLVQEARAAQERGDYKAAQTAAADANTTLSTATKDLEDAAAAAAKRRR